MTPALVYIMYLMRHDDGYARCLGDPGAPDPSDAPGPTPRTHPRTDPGSDGTTRMDAHDAPAVASSAVPPPVADVSRIACTSPSRAAYSCRDPLEAASSESRR